MTFSVALMMKMIARYAGLPSVSNERLRASDGGSELLDRVGLGLMVVLVGCCGSVERIIDGNQVCNDHAKE